MSAIPAWKRLLRAGVAVSISGFEAHPECFFPNADNSPFICNGLYSSSMNGGCQPATGRELEFGLKLYF